MALTGLEVVEVRGLRRTRQFLELPAAVHRHHRGWVPPLRADERRLLKSHRNPASAYCDSEAWLALVDGRPAGRIVGIVNHRYNELRGERTARFSHLESVDNRDVIRCLLGRVEDWAREHRMTLVEGPRGFTDQDPEGLLIEGFDHEAAFASYQNRESTVRLVEEAGYEKAVDYVVYQIPVPDERPEFYERIRDRVLSRGTYRLLEFESRRALRPWVLPILEMMNETFEGLSGYSPLAPRELRALARQYRPIVDPRFVKVVLAGDEPAGFIVALPSLNEGLRRCRGRLLPIGWIHILRSARTSRCQLDLLIGGTRDGHRGRGVDVLLGDAMTRSARRACFEFMDSHHELESNLRVRREMERMGGRVYKRFRVFAKAL